MYTFTVPQELCSVIKQTKPFISTDDSRKVLHGVFLDNCYLAATSGNVSIESSVRPFFVPKTLKII